MASREIAEGEYIVNNTFMDKVHRKKLVCYLGKTGVPNKHRVCYCISLTH